MLRRGIFRFIVELGAPPSKLLFLGLLERRQRRRQICLKIINTSSTEITHKAELKNIMKHMA